MGKTEDVAAVIGTIERQFGKNAIMTLGAGHDPGGPVEEKMEVLSTGSLALDLATRIGGYPKGRVVEIYGPASSGKTTIALHAIAETQRAGGVAAVVDTDHAFDVTYARAIGVGTEKLLVSQPDTSEQAFDIAEVLARSGAVDLIVFDSVLGLTPRAELEGEAGPDDLALGLRARLMSQTLRKLTAIAHRTGTIVLFVNTLRTADPRIGGLADRLIGGNALKFYASLRLDVRAIGERLITAGGTVPDVYGIHVKVKVAKNKCAAPFTEAEFSIRYGAGIDTDGELIDLGVARGLVEKNGEHYVFAGGLLGRGRERARETVRANAEIRATMKQAILASRPT